jgi:hypothetical protein
MEDLTPEIDVSVDVLSHGQPQCLQHA